MLHKQELSWDERTVHATWVPENFKNAEMSGEKSTILLLLLIAQDSSVLQEEPQNVDRFFRRKPIW